MNPTINTLLLKLSMRPRSVFLMDGVGALLSAMLLVGLIAPFEYIFGMPRKALCNFSIIAFVFAIYSLSCYLLDVKRWELFLRITGFGNIFYCLTTFGFLVQVHKTVSALGIVYFAGEMMLILLAALELTVIKRGCRDR